MNKLGVVEIIVKDFDVCVKFYRDLLGLEIEQLEKEHNFVLFDTGETKLALFGAEKFYKGKYSHIKLYFPTTNIEISVQEMKGKGIKFTSEIQERHWGKVTTFIDPEGNEHYLYQEFRQ